MAMTPTIWATLPIEVHDPMAALWADLLCRHLSSCRAPEGQTHHEQPVQGGATPHPSARRHLHPAVDAAAGTQQPGGHPPPVPAGRAARQMGWPDANIRVIDDDLGLSEPVASSVSASSAWLRRSVWVEVGIVLVTEILPGCRA